MRVLRFFSLACGLLATSLSTGHARCGVVELRGEFLYFRPSCCNNDYVITDTIPFVQEEHTAPFGVVRRVGQGHEPGFRVTGGWLHCASLYDATLSYTHLRRNKRGEAGPEVQDGSIWPTFGAPINLNFPLNTADLPEPFGPTQALAIARERFNYHAAELQVGHRSHHNQNFCLRTWGALHYAYIEHLRDAYYQGAVILDLAFPTRNSTVHWRSRSWAVGPKVGVDMRLNVCNGFGLSGNFGGSLLGGQRARHFRQLDNLFFNDEGELGVLPIETELAFHNSLTVFVGLFARLGVSYGLRCGCWTLLLEAGYEYINYLNALEVINFTASESGFNLLCEDARLDGPYAAVRLEF